MYTLTLDLGTKTGWTITDESVLQSGTIKLASEEELQLQRVEGKERTLDVRFVRLLNFIATHVQQGKVKRIVFEDVQFASTQMQAQLWASLRAAIWGAINGTNIEVFCVPVGTLKVFATGSGSAKKPEMASSLSKVEPTIYTLSPQGTLLKTEGTEVITIDDNEVDAIWLGRFDISVEKGERDYTGVYQRKAKEKAEKRAKKLQKRNEAKAKAAADKAELKVKADKLKASIKALGRCCGVWREAAPFGKAVCPKCQVAISIPKD